MNLIEELGIEKARAIVDCAPEGSLIFLEIMPECDYHAYFAKSSEFSQETAMIWDRDGWVGVDDGAIINARLDHAPYIKIEDLRTAIVNHGTPTNEGTSNTDNLPPPFHRPLHRHSQPH